MSEWILIKRNRNISIALQGHRNDESQIADTLRTIDGILQFLLILSATRYAQERTLLWSAKCIAIQN